MREAALIRQDIIDGKTVVGIELGSARIKAVLIDSSYKTVASSSCDWEMELSRGVWTLSLDQIWKGLQNTYQDLIADIAEKYGIIPERFGSIGFSAMMHGYMVFNRKKELLVPFRTWQNTSTRDAASQLSGLFHYNIPQRWSISHLYQAIRDREEHVRQIAYMTTLSGYIHWQLTGQKVLGIGDASGMFPVDVLTHDYRADMVHKFDELVETQNLPWTLSDILPKILLAGEDAGTLTVSGARKLDVSGHLKAGVPVCPPEGVAGTGMAATNSVKKRKGSVSVGTSVFTMVVLDHELSKPYPELDLLMSPDGNLVSMTHCSNCMSDLNAWSGLFHDFARRLSVDIDANVLYGLLYRSALEGDPDGGGSIPFGFYTGEPVLNLEKGFPLLLHRADAKFSLANFMRAELYSSLAGLKIGMDILTRCEHVQIDELAGHGGFFKTKGVGQRILAAVTGLPVSVMDQAAESGARGIALLAAYRIYHEKEQRLDEFLDNHVFASEKIVRIEPEEEDIRGFEHFFSQYKKLFPAEQLAVKLLTQ